MFDPANAKTCSLNVSYIDAFDCINPFVAHKLIPDLKKELPKFISACEEFKASGDEANYTLDVLHFWAQQRHEIPAWAKAARIVFSLSPSSAACERVFSLLKLFFGEQREVCLADQLQTALMLAFNKRSLG